MAHYFGINNASVTNSDGLDQFGLHSLRSWSDLDDGWFQSEDGHLSSLATNGTTSRNPKAQPKGGNIQNGPDSMPISSASPTRVPNSDNTDEFESRLSRSMDYDNHESLANFSYVSDPRDAESLSTSSIDYLWDVEEVRDSRKFHSLPHGSVYSITNGSLPGSPVRSRRSQPENSDQTEKIKSKLMSAWNNMRHGWTMRMTTSFKYDDPIWLMGKYYHSPPSEREIHKNKQQRGIPVLTSMEKFKRDFTSRIWFTYRRNFPPLANSQYTSDVGWGCMIRTGQMMIAQALLVHFLGRDWWWYPSQRPQEVIYHHQIVRLFGDNPSPASPFSIHKLVDIGKNLGKAPGDWYGPSSVAHVLSEAVLQAKSTPIAGQICVYIAQDCTVYKQDILDLCAMMGSRRNSSSHGRLGSNMSDESQPSPVPEVEDPWKAVVILVPVRLGGESLNPTYIPCVRNILTYRMSLGVIGGKPKHSVYFVGWQDDKLIYLDPHFCQENVDVHMKNFSLSTYHCMSPRKLPFKNMDPSCTIGFYCKTRIDFETFIREVPQLVTTTKERGQHPLFIVSDGRASDINYKFSSPRISERAQSRISNEGISARTRENSKESDDFVFL